MALIHKLEKAIKKYKKHDFNMRRKGIGTIEEMGREAKGRAENKEKKMSMARKISREELVARHKARYASKYTPEAIKKRHQEMRSFLPPVGASHEPRNSRERGDYQNRIGRAYND